MSRFSPHKVKAYFGESNRETREDIRRELLSDRYSDILSEKSHLESLLGIKEKESAAIVDETDDLYEITKILFDMIEMMIPELALEEEESDEEKTKEVVDANEAAPDKLEKSDAARRTATKKKIVDRERKAKAVIGKRGKDTYTKSRHDLMKAQMKYDKANNPQSLKTAKAGLDSARKRMSNVRHK
jgi:hypothetical protein